jgi:hypothetical protein
MHIQVSSERVRRLRPPSKTRAAAPGLPILELQRAAGNRAVAERLIARQPKAAEAPEMQPEATGGSTTVEMEGIGTLKATSVSFEEQRKEVHVTAESSDLTPTMMQYLSEGKKIPKVVITLGKVTFTLTDVYISGLRTGGGSSPYDNVTFTYGQMSRSAEGYEGLAG